MFERSAYIYDLAKQHRDYAAEAAELRSVIPNNVKFGSILDVACGTGNLLKEFRDCDYYGIDLSDDMIAVARTKLDADRVIRADMKNFDIQRQFDLTVCVDGSIGYNVTRESLGDTLASIYRHTRRGGFFIVEPWYSAESLRIGTPFVVARFPDVSDPRLVFRVSIAKEGGVIDFHHVVSDGMYVDYFKESSQFGLYSIADLVSMIEHVGFNEVQFSNPTIVFKRGLVIARK